MVDCEHSKLYYMDFANQPERLEPCLFCERDSLLLRLGKIKNGLEHAYPDEANRTPLEQWIIDLCSGIEPVVETHGCNTQFIPGDDVDVWELCTLPKGHEGPHRYGSE